MRILLIHRYFWPDTPPYAAMLRSIGKRLVDEGYDVTVLSSQPSYKEGVALSRQPITENIDGMEVNRITLFRERGKNVVFRLINMFYFPLRIVLFSLIKEKFDIIMVSTAPPVVVGFATSLGAKITGASFIYHCMDIHPEIGRISGEFKKPIVFKSLMFLDKISCRIAKKVIVLSKDMKNALLSRPGYLVDNIQVINNFSMPFHGVPLCLAPELIKPAGIFRVIFAGNIGRFQGLEVFVDAMRKLINRTSIELIFVGEGAALSELKKCAYGLKNIKFFPHQSVKTAKKMIADADLGIVSLVKGIYQFAYPSKTMTYLDEGCPLLVSVERESELADFVESSNVGVLCTPGCSQSIADAIYMTYSDKTRYRRMKVAAKQAGDKMFSEQAVMEKWVSLVNSVAANN